MADFFTEAGHGVDLLTGTDSVAPQFMKRYTRYTDFKDLDLRLKQTLSGTPYDIILHAAAVSDYSVAGVEQDGVLSSVSNGKLSSTAENLILHLKRNFKILDRLKSYAGNCSVIVAFKLTNTQDPEERQKAIHAMGTNPSVDFTVHNDISEFTEAEHPYCLFKSTRLLGKTTHVLGLAKLLDQHLIKEKS